MRSETHSQRILSLLEEAGEKGVHSFDLAKRVSFRAAARVNDLKKHGYTILSRPEKRGQSLGVRYVLEGK